jgi:Fur family ferric uptake transcriptional regulator
MTDPMGAGIAWPAMADSVRDHGDAPPGGRADIEGIMARLRHHGGRITATRRVTIEVLLAGGEHRHLSAEDIAAKVRDRLPEVAESTIYRTLSALEDLGIITHVHLGHGASTYHLSDQAHRHLVCRRCQAVVEVPTLDFDEFVRRLEDSYGFVVSDEHFALVGECRACRDQHDD